MMKSRRHQKSSVHLPPYEIAVWESKIWFIVLNVGPKYMAPRFALIGVLLFTVQIMKEGVT